VPKKPALAGFFGGTRGPAGAQDWDAHYPKPGLMRKTRLNPWFRE